MGNTILVNSYRFNVALAQGGANLPDLNEVNLTYVGLAGASAGLPDMDELVGLDFHPNGLKMWIHQDFDGNVPKLAEFDLSPAWDITSATFNSVSAQTNNYGGPRFMDCQWKDDGTAIYFCGFNDGDMYRIDVSTPYTMDWLALPTPDQSATTSFGNSTLVGFSFHNNGTKLFLTGLSDAVVYYSLSTPWDLTTMSLESTGSVAGAPGAGEDVIVSDDGLRVWAMPSGEALTQWDLVTPFDMTEVTGAADATVSLQNIQAANSRMIYVPIDRNEVYVGWYGTGPTTTFVEKYTWDDPFWSSVVLLLSFDGSDGATTTADKSNSGHAITFNSNAQIDTAQSKWGGSSLLLDGISDYVSAVDDDDWSFGNADWTVECWARFNGDPGTTNMTFAAQWEDTAGKSWIFDFFNNEARMLFSANGTTGFFGLTAAWNPVGDTWYHVACVRSSAGITIYVGGLSIGTSAAIGSNILFNSTAPLRVGSADVPSESGANFDGWLEEVRITKGVARYTVNFIVPNGPFSVT